MCEQEAPSPGFELSVQLLFPWSVAPSGAGHPRLKKPNKAQ